MKTPLFKGRNLGYPDTPKTLYWTLEKWLKKDHGGIDQQLFQKSGNFKNTNHKNATGPPKKHETISVTQKTRGYEKNTHLTPGYLKRPKD